MSIQQMLMAAGGLDQYLIANSLRFNDDDLANLSKTFSSAGDLQTWTWSGWVKFNTISGNQAILSSDEAGSNFHMLYLQADGTLKWDDVIGGSDVQLNKITNQVFRDFSAWYHLVLVVDTTNLTAADRNKMYVNNVQATFASGNDFSQNDNSQFNQGSAFDCNIGSGDNANYTSAYLADVHFVDGTALTASDFGETNADTGQWVPKEYSGSYGTNGFYLKFNGTDLGEDSSGQGNDWTANNLTADPGVATTLVSADTFSDDVTYYSNGAGLDGAATLMFNGGDTYQDNTYCGTNNAANHITWTPATSIPDTAHNGYIWICGGNGNGQGLDNMNVYINGSGSPSTHTAVIDDARYANDYFDWWKYTVSGTFTSFKVEGVYTTVRGVSFQETPAFTGCHMVDGEDHMSHGVDMADVDVLTESPTDFDDEGNGTGNYCTLNPLSNALTLSEGNLKATQGSVAHEKVYGTFGMKTGAWYWEVTKHDDSSDSATSLGLGITNAANMVLTGFPTDDNHFTYLQGAAIYYDDGIYPTSTPAVDVPGGDEHSAGVWMFAFDFDNGEGWIGKDGTWFKPGGTGGNPATGADPIFTNFEAGATFCPMIHIYNVCSVTANFGQRAFAYTPPTGFKALNTYNLPDPTIEDPSKHFDVGLDAGADILTTALGLTDGADFVWIKDRDNTDDHILFNRINDSDMDGDPHLISNDTDTEATCGAYSAPTGNSVAWVWNAGSSTVSNTDGDITSSVRANPSAGFSIVNWTSIAWTGSAANRQVGHGLNASPSFIITKGRENAGGWYTYHKDLDASNPQDYYVTLNTSNARGNLADSFGPSTPDSTTFGDRLLGWTAGQEAIAYCFAPVEGYSAFGSYEGTRLGSPNGVFVYCGFKPAWILVKNTEDVEDWYMWDNKRDGYNPTWQFLEAHDTDVENSTTNHGTIDIVSNGFKLRVQYAPNQDKTYIFAAFAESSFKHSNAR